MKVNLDFYKDNKADITTPFVKKIIKGVLSAVADIPEEVSLSVALVSDQTIRKINKQYRGHDKVTDVLSFSGQIRGFRDPEPDLGEVLIAIGQCARQARQYGHSNKKEFARLLIHGTLHLLGFDHQTEEQAAVMEKLEKKLLIDIYGQSE